MKPMYFLLLSVSFFLLFLLPFIAWLLSFQVRRAFALSCAAYCVITYVMGIGDSSIFLLIFNSSMYFPLPLNRRSTQWQHHDPRDRELVPHRLWIHIRQLPQGWTKRTLFSLFFFSYSLPSVCRDWERDDPVCTHAWNGLCDGRPGKPNLQRIHGYFPLDFSFIIPVGVHIFFPLSRVRVTLHMKSSEITATSSLPSSPWCSPQECRTSKR